MQTPHKNTNSSHLKKLLNNLERLRIMSLTNHQILSPLVIFYVPPQSCEYGPQLITILLKQTLQTIPKTT